MKDIILKFKSNKNNLLSYGLIFIWIAICMVIYVLFGNS